MVLFELWIAHQTIAYIIPGTIIWYVINPKSRSLRVLLRRTLIIEDNHLKVRRKEFLRSIWLIWWTTVSLTQLQSYLYPSLANCRPLLLFLSSTKCFYTWFSGIKEFFLTYRLIGNLLDALTEASQQLQAQLLLQQQQQPLSWYSSL